MAILAQEGESYARLRFSAGPGGELVIPVEVDFTDSFAATDHVAWQDEYDRYVSALNHPLSGAARDLADTARPLSASHFDLFDFPVSESPAWEFHSEYDQRCCS